MVSKQSPAAHPHAAPQTFPPTSEEPQQGNKAEHTRLSSDGQRDPAGPSTERRWQQLSLTGSASPAGPSANGTAPSLPAPTQRVVPRSSTAGGRPTGRRGTHPAVLAALHLPVPGLQLAAQLAVIRLLLLQLLAVRIHPAQQVGVALLQPPSGHLGALGLALQLGQLLPQHGLARRRVPAVEGEDGDHEQQGGQQEGGQAAAPPVGPEAHHGGGRRAGAAPALRLRPRLRGAAQNGAAGPAEDRLRAADAHRPQSRAGGAPPSSRPAAAPPLPPPTSRETLRCQISRERRAPLPGSVAPRSHSAAWRPFRESSAPWGAPINAGSARVVAGLPRSFPVPPRQLRLTGEGQNVSEAQSGSGHGLRPIPAARSGVPAGNGGAPGCEQRRRGTQELFSVHAPHGCSSCGNAAVPRTAPHSRRVPRGAACSSAVRPAGGAARRSAAAGANPLPGRPARRSSAASDIGGTSCGAPSVLRGCRGCASHGGAATPSGRSSARGCGSQRRSAALTELRGAGSRPDKAALCPNADSAESDGSG